MSPYMGTIIYIIYITCSKKELNKEKEEEEILEIQKEKKRIKVYYQQNQIYLYKIICLFK